jgi:hypothetical protein
MKIRSMALAFLFAAGTLAACHGASTYTPQLGDSTGASGASGGMLAHPSLPEGFASLQDAVAHAAGTCTTANEKLPGEYLFMLAEGKVTGTTFSTKGALVSEWTLNKYTVVAHPTPTPHPTSEPTTGPTPKPAKIWYYLGNYTLKVHKQSGCAILITSQNGKPFLSTISAIAENAVTFSQPNFKEGPNLAAGVLSETVTGLSASGGHGTATLTTTKGAPYDTATITLLGRTGEKF